MVKYTRHFLTITVASLATSLMAQQPQASGTPYLLSQSIDMSRDFGETANTFFFADSLSDFNTAEATGKLKWKRHAIVPRQAFNTNGIWPQPLQMLDFPTPAYDNDPELGISLEFISERCVRLRIATSNTPAKEVDELMIAGELPTSSAWQASTDQEGNVRYTSPAGSITLCRHPWRLELRDANGRLIQQSRATIDNDTTQVKSLPFCFIKRGSDNSRSIAPMLSLMPGERIYGCGESFTSLNKVGQKVNICVTDPQGPETDQMYKPVPFFMSSKGYGIFLHTSAPVTADFGASYVGTSKLFMADETLDAFIFFGEPKDILDEYTNITGKAPMPPLWSFGTWMSRITYFTQDEGYDVARQIRKNKIPADVIHFDTGWFGTDWQCDYRFASDRFSNPEKMIADLKDDGFHISLWQLPYFTPKNAYFNELIEKDLYVHNAAGSLPYEDVVLDFSNPATVAWYQEKIAGLLKLGVGAIKVDFGESAPLHNGLYASGRTGLYEHNLYPLRYNKAVADITRATSGDNIIWARSAWAGSQRYPLHWGGDAANTNAAMLSTLRGGLSFGLSGFAFWSHDMGGFVQSTPEELYRRWLPFGFLTSHTRAHGAPPTEPWLYNDDFCQAFRTAAELKYALMPYVYAQAKLCTEKGLPMVRALFVEYPHDPGAWLVEDQYLFGTDLLVAPLFEQSTSRMVYLPGTTKWIDYQTQKSYSPGWNEIEVGEIPCVILVRDGAIVPTVPVAQHTALIDWNKVTANVYLSDQTEATGLLCLPSDQELITLTSSAAQGWTKPQNVAAINVIRSK